MGERQKHSFKVTVGVSIAVFIVTAVLFVLLRGGSTGLMMGFVFCTVPWGWRGIGLVAAKIFEKSPGRLQAVFIGAKEGAQRGSAYAGLFGKIIKFIIAFAVGWFAMPIQIIVFIVQNVNKSDNGSLKRGDKKFVELIRANEAGEEWARKKVSKMWDDGEITTTDIGAAWVVIYRPTAESGDSAAQLKLAQGLENIDPDEAMQWYKKLTSQGNVAAMKRLAFAYGFEYSLIGGEGEHPDEELYWYLEAAKRGDAEAQYEVGRCYFLEKQDYDMAWQWYSSAAENGNAAGAVGMAQVLERRKSSLDFQAPDYKEMCNDAEAEIEEILLEILNCEFETQTDHDAASAFKMMGDINRYATYTEDRDYDRVVHCYYMAWWLDPDYHEVTKQQMEKLAAEHEIDISAERLKYWEERGYDKDKEDDDMELKTCSNPVCAKNIPLNAKFCPKCGETQKVAQMVSVLDLSIQERSVAEDALRAQGLQANVTEAFSETITQGCVVSQAPAAGVTIVEGGTVALVVSKGREPIIVPRLVNAQKENAIHRLEELELVVAFAEEVYNETLEANVVLEQTPDSGSELYKGNVVTLTVSKGKKPEKPVVSSPVPQEEKWKFCLDCGNKIPAYSKFCPFCGFRNDWEVELELEEAEG